MADWSKQFQESVKTWTEMQEQARERWAEAARSLTGSDVGTRWQQDAGKIVDAWQESVKASVDFPAEQARAWAENVARADAAPKPLQEWAKRLQASAEALAGLQKQVIDTWFASLRSLTPSEGEGSWDRLLDTWRETSQKALEAQAEWMRLWTSGFEARESRRQAGKGSAAGSKS